MADDPEKLAKAFVARMMTEAQGWLLDRTVSILLGDGPGAVTQHGTGVLLAIADAVFLVSANHVLTDLSDHDLWINPVANGCPIIALERSDVFASADGRIVDFGFLRIPEEDLAELSSAKRFVRLDEIETRVPPLGWYAILGYPLELNVFKSTTVKVPTVPMYYGTRLHDTVADPLAGFDPAVNLALELPLHRSGVPQTNTPTTLPDFRGTSGSGIWRLYQNGEAVTSWTPKQIRLTGVVHTRGGRSGLFGTQSGEATIIGVHFAHVVRAIGREFPELEFALAPYGLLAT